ncbi:MAG: sensor histidine kinase [Actinomycetes bacterium]
MDTTVAAVLAGALGLLVGAFAVLAFTYSERQLTTVPPAPEPELPPGTAEVLAVLSSAAIVLDESRVVIKASPAAYAFGIVRGQAVAHPQLLTMVEDVRRDGEIREAELELPRGPLGRELLVVHARVAPLGARHVLLLVADRTEARRLEEVRRDFVANVSHELKTPVGAISLLAETIADSAEDADAVRRFALRMGRESERLAHLVQDIIDLSRLQSAPSLSEPVLVDVDTVVAEAVDRSRLAAQAADVVVEIGPPSGASVYGDPDLLTTAVRNLVDNAIRYSEPRTRVGVGVRLQRGLVEIAVTDQGIGIPENELDRVFERFYRIDPARSRATGGTGLGLSIVKHVAANHGGDVTVWSKPGHGSTFTLRLPDAQTGGPRRPPVTPRQQPAVPTVPDHGTRTPQGA